MLTRYFSRLLVGLLVVLPASITHANPQLGAVDLPSIGDIIEFEHAVDGTSYGLVLEASRGTIKVERQKRSRGRRGTSGAMVFDTHRVPTLNGEWTVIDSMEQRKADSKSEYRTWKSKDGGSKIEASFVRIEDDKVRLKKKSNGKTISIALSKLSDADQEFIKQKNGDDLFAVEEEDDYPEEVLVLIGRRKMYMGIQQRHEQLARKNRNLMLGDIVFYERFAQGNGLGIVTSMDFGGRVESVDKDGELDSAKPIHGNWWFYDRPTLPLKPRTWSSPSGKFKITATLVEISDGDKLLLRKKDGDTMSVDLGKLGDKDHAWVKKNRGRLAKSDNSQTEPLDGDFEKDLEVLLTRRADIIEFYEASNVAANDAAKMKSISLNARTPNMEASQLLPLSLNKNSFDVSVGLNLPKHARIERVSYAEDASKVAFVASSPFHGAPVLAVVDVNTGDASVNEDSEQVGDDAEVLTVSPSGQTILVYSEDGFNKQQLEHWRLVDGTLKRIAIVPYKTFHTPKAHMFTDDKGCILNFHGDLVFFDLTERIKPTHIVAGSRMTHGTTMQISHDQKSVFYFGEQSSSLHFIDVDKKRCSGGLQFDADRSAGSPYAQVNSDGETATFLFGRYLAIYDIASGDIIKEHEMPSHFSRAFFDDDAFPMLSDTLLQTFHSKIFDLNLDAEVGKIEGHSHGVQHFSNSSRIVAKVDSNESSGRGGFAAGGRHGGGGDGMLHSTVNIKYESLNVKAIEAFANSLTDGDIVKFGGGDTVRLDIDLGNASMNRRLEDKLNDEMADAGIDVVRDSDFVLKATYTVGQPKTERFRIIGRFGTPESTRKVTITPKSCTASLLYKGAVIWSRSDSVALGRPWSVEDLNAKVKKASSLSAARLLEFTYPHDMRVLHPEKVRTFKWE